MKIKIGKTEFEITDEYSDDDIIYLHCLALVSLVASTILITIGQILGVI